MWIYYNKLGELTTKIPHGEVVRQGATFNIYIALDPRIFEEDINSIPGENFNSYNLEALKQWVQQNIQAKIQILNVGVSTILNDQPTIQQFLKIKTSEITYDLIHGRYYLVYHYVGYHTLLTRCGNYTATFELENALNSTKKVLGNITFYAEKTLGNTNTNVAGSVVIANPPLTGNEENLRGVEIDGERYKISSQAENNKLELVATGTYDETYSNTHTKAYTLSDTLSVNQVYIIKLYSAMYGDYSSVVLFTNEYTNGSTVVNWFWVNSTTGDDGSCPCSLYVMRNRMYIMSYDKTLSLYCSKDDTIEIYKLPISL